MEFKKTSRGFSYVEFTDANNESCSLQASSSIDDTDEGLENPGSSFIWLGIDDIQPKLLASDALALDMHISETTGWVTYPIPKEVDLSGRMHLGRVQVKQLIELLTQWYDNGIIKEN